MREKLLVACVAVCLAVFSLPARAGAEEAMDPGLVTGVRQTQVGEFEAAVATLDEVVQRLSAEGGQPKQLARAYLYLSIAYLGLSEGQKAKAKFTEALRTDMELELSPSEFPPKILRFFEEARGELPAAQPREPAAPEESRPRDVVEPRRSRGGRHATFKKIDFFEIEGDKEKSRDARLILDPARGQITFADEKKGPAKATYLVIPYDAVRELTYELTKHRRKARALLFKGEKHVLTISYEVPGGGEAFALANLHKDNFFAVLSALEAATGVDTIIVSDEEE
jgi:hypothetical protein